MSLDKAIKNLILDTRMIELNLSQGQLTKEELKKHLDALPDLANNCETLDIEDRNSSKNEQH